MGEQAAVIEVSSKTSPGKKYRIWVGANGPIFCDCPAHKFHKGKPAGQRPDCKHMREIRGDATVLTTAASLVAGTATADSLGTGRFSFLEIQEQTDEGTWVPVSRNLSRFNNLEVN